MVTRMRPFAGTIPLHEAQAIIARTVRPLDRIEQVALDRSHGRVLARDVVAPADVPPFTRAAMDGYAVRAADTIGASRSHPCIVRRIEQIFTGQVPTNEVGAGECAEIATGAPMPPGADAVVIVEDTSADEGGNVRVYNAVSPAQNIGRQGADIQSGQIVLRAGDLLNASRVGALAALGTTRVEVFAKPRVAILST